MGASPPRRGNAVGGESGGTDRPVDGGNRAVRKRYFVLAASALAAGLAAFGTVGANRRAAPPRSSSRHYPFYPLRTTPRQQKA